MDTDEPDGGGHTGEGGGPHLITRSLRDRSRARCRADAAATGRPSPRDLEAAARLAEERNVHSLYRAACRASQLLDLLSHLRRAQGTPGLPEVRWGALHGLTYCQLATTGQGQDRIDAVLANLVSGDAEPAGAAAGPYARPETAEADVLSSRLSRRCYLYYSAGSRLTYMGFRAARDAARSCPPNSSVRVALANKAAGYLSAAARHWHSPSLVAGRSVHGGAAPSSAAGGGTVAKGIGGGLSWYDEVAVGALEGGSPLALAAAALADLGDGGSAADVCLTCAVNFGGGRSASSLSPLARLGAGEDPSEGGTGAVGGGGEADGALPWERGLYHGPKTGGAGAGAAPSRSSSSSSGSLVSGVEVTAADALRTCHAVLFHHLTRLLDSASSGDGAGEAVSSSADRMVAVCCASPDLNFLHSLFEHLLSTDRVGVLLRIDSEALELWLTNVRGDPDLLWRYYVVHHRYVAAGDVMWKRASTAEQRVSLDERIECLTRAGSSYRDAAEKGADRVVRDMSRFGYPNGGAAAVAGGPGDALASHPGASPSREELNRRLVQIREQLDVANLQRRVLDGAGEADSLDAAGLDRLRNSLVNATNLYNDYAAPLSLYDLCLLLMRTCNLNEPDHVATLWRSILSEEVLPCQTRSGPVRAFLNEMAGGGMVQDDCDLLGDGDAGDPSVTLFEDGKWIPRLKDRVISVGRELYGKGADYTFPLQLLVNSLEGLRFVYGSCSSASSDALSWPLSVFLKVGVQYSPLLEAYDSAVSFPVGGGIGREDPERRVMQLASVSEVLTQWVRSAFSPYNHQSDIVGEGNTILAQLSQAVSSGGLLMRIDNYKELLESTTARNGEERAKVHASLRDVEDAIRENMR